MVLSTPPKFSRLRLILATVVINAIAFTMVFFGLHKLYERDIKQAEIRAQTISRGLEQGFGYEIRRIDLSLMTVTSELTENLIRNGKLNPERISERIRIQKGLLKEAEGWSVTDARGQVTVHQGGVIRPDFALTDRQYFKDLQSGRVTGLLISKPIVSRLTGATVLAFARAYQDKTGRFAGIAVIMFPLSYLEQLLAGFELGDNGILTLRDSNLGIIARVPSVIESKQLAVGDDRVSETLRSLVSRGLPQATYMARNVVDGVERIHSYRQVGDTGIIALAGISKESALASWYRQRNLSLILFGFFLLITNASLVLLRRQWQIQRQFSTQLQTSLKQLQERDSALLSAQEAGGLGTYTLDISTGVWIASEKQDEILGIDSVYPHTVEGWIQLIHEDDREWMTTYFVQEVIGKKSMFDREYRIVRPYDGSVVWIHGLGKLEFDVDGHPVLMRGTLRDVSDRKQSEERLYLARDVFQNATEGILITDKQSHIIDINPAFTKITGYRYEDAIGQTPRILSSGTHDKPFFEEFWASLLSKGGWEGEIVNRRKDGTIYTQYSRISALRDRRGEITRFSALISDITESKQSQQQIEYLAYHDKLTGLPNRTLFSDRLKQAITLAKRHKELLGVCYLDIDSFKPVNDEFGHVVGDQLLVEVGKRLLASIRASDTVARFGGDEFVVLFCGLKTETEVEQAAARMAQLVSRPLALDSVHVALTISVGISIYPNDPAEDSDALIRHADQAMYEAKRKGKNCIQFFDPESDLRGQEFQAQYSRLVQALANGEFRLHYQPKVELKTGRVAGVEALVRWQHPEQGLLAPAHFLPVIEQTELTLPVGEWILHEAMQQVQRWQRQGIFLPVSVNIFAKHLQRSDFAERLRSILDAYPEVDPSSLELEILETTALENLEEITRCLNECLNMGVRFSLDDFGTGYSSLTYFRQLPVDIVKIDRSFVRDMLEDTNDQALVQNIISMARILQRKVVAEGVETLEHGIPLLQSGCDLAQGFGIAKPMPPEHFQAWLSQWQMPESWKGHI